MASAEPQSGLLLVEVSPEPLAKAAGEMTAADVYALAALMGREVEALAAACGGDALASLLPLVVRTLEMLEELATRNGDAALAAQREHLATLRADRVRWLAKDSLREQELEATERTWEVRESELLESLAQSEQETSRLQVSLKLHQGAQLLEENRDTQSEGVGEKERDVMLRLKEVVDKQRDEMRAKDHDIANKTQDIEALQQQLARLMKLNNELRHKLAVLDAQGRALAGQRAELEAGMQVREQELTQLRETAACVAGAYLEQVDETSEETDFEAQPEVEPDANGPNQQTTDNNDPNRPRFTLQELRDVLQERNELKAKLFLLQEELVYYKSECEETEDCTTGASSASLPDGQRRSQQESSIRRLFSFFKDRQSTAAPRKSLTMSHGQP
uniref:RILP-like protein 1 isoform X1 n=1 Tax=Myxine glutinosa TaxID=7769 RepID=UPI00358E8C8A